MIGPQAGLLNPVTFMQSHPRSGVPKSYPSSILEIYWQLVHAWLCLLARYAGTNVSLQGIGATPEQKSGLDVEDARNFRGDARFIIIVAQDTFIQWVKLPGVWVAVVSTAAGLRYTLGALR